MPKSKFNASEEQRLEKLENERLRKSKTRQSEFTEQQNLRMKKFDLKYSIPD